MGRPNLPRDADAARARARIGRPGRSASRCGRWLSAGANPLGVWDSAAALFDARDGATTSGVVTVRAVAAAALFVTPCTPTGRATLYNFVAATGINGECAMAATIAYDRPEQPSDAASDTTCAFSDDALGDGLLPVERRGTIWWAAPSPRTRIVQSTAPRSSAAHASSSARVGCRPTRLWRCTGAELKIVPSDTDGTLSVVGQFWHRSCPPRISRPPSRSSLTASTSPGWREWRSSLRTQTSSQSTASSVAPSTAGAYAVRLADSSIVRYEFAVANNVAAIARIDAARRNFSTLDAAERRHRRLLA